MITGIVSSHPEIGEALRNITRNTTNGTYWAGHREALSQAAAEFQRSTEALAEEGRRAVEEDAGRRVAEALAGVLRIFSQTQVPTPVQPSPNATTANVRTSSDPHPRPQTPPVPGGFPTGSRSASAGGIPFNPWHTWQSFPLVPPSLRAGQWMMPPPFGSGALNTTNAPSAVPPNVSAAPAGAHPAHATQPTAQLNPEASTTKPTDEPVSPLEVKAKVEETKRAYKEAKDRYRQRKEEMKKRRENTNKREDTM